MKYAVASCKQQGDVGFQALTLTPTSHVAGICIHLIHRSMNACSSQHKPGGFLAILISTPCPYSNHPHSSSTHPALIGGVTVLGVWA